MVFVIMYFLMSIIITVIYFSVFTVKEVVMELSNLEWLWLFLVLLLFSPILIMIVMILELFRK